MWGASTRNSFTEPRSESSSFLIIYRPSFHPIFHDQCPSPYIAIPGLSLIPKTQHRLFFFSPSFRPDLRFTSLKHPIWNQAQCVSLLLLRCFTPSSSCRFLWWFRVRPSEQVRNARSLGIEGAPFLPWLTHRFTLRYSREQWSPIRWPRAPDCVQKEYRLR